MNLSSLPPSKRILLGFIFIVVAIIAGIISAIITTWFIIHIGFFTTVIMYVVLIIMGIVSLILLRCRRRGHGLSVIHTWDTEAADEVGSTARYGYPLDPGSYMPKWIYKGQPRRPQDFRDHP